MDLRTCSNALGHRVKEKHIFEAFWRPLNGLVATGWSQRLSERLQVAPTKVEGIGLQLSRRRKTIPHLSFWMLPAFLGFQLIALETIVCYWMYAFWGGPHVGLYNIRTRDYSSWGKNMVKPARDCGERLDHSPASRWFLKVKLSANWWIIVARMAYDGWWMECCSEELWWTAWLAEQGFAFVSLTLFGPFGLEGPFAAWATQSCVSPTKASCLCASG